MRGSAIPMVFFIFTALLILMISIMMVISLQEALEEESVEFISRIRVMRTYSFNVDDILKPVCGEDDFNCRNTGDTSYDNHNSIELYFTGYDPQYGKPDDSVKVTDDPQFCRDLRKCIKESILSGQSCEISLEFSKFINIKDGLNRLSEDMIFDDGFNCSEMQIYKEDFTEEEDAEVKQQICKFVPDSGIWEDHYNFLYYGYPDLDDANKPSPYSNWDNIEPHLPYIYGGYLYTRFGRIDEDRDTVAFFPMPGHPEDDLKYFYDFQNYTAGGRLRILVYNASVFNDPDRTCNFSMMVVPQPAIGSTTKDIGYQLFSLTYLLDDEALAKRPEQLKPGTYVEFFQDSQYDCDSRKYTNTSISSFHSDYFNIIGSDCANSEGYEYLTRFNTVADNASSMKTQGDVIVFLFENKNFNKNSGKIRIYTDDIPYFQNFNDKLSSMIAWNRGQYYIFGYFPRVYNHTFSANEHRLSLDEIIEPLRVGMIEWNKLHYNDRNKIEMYEEGSEAKYIALNFSNWDLVDMTYNSERPEFNDDCWSDGMDKINYYDYGPTVFYNSEGFDDYDELKVTFGLFKREHDEKDMYYYGEEDDNAHVIELVPIVTICTNRDSYK